MNHLNKEGSSTELFDMLYSRKYDMEEHYFMRMSICFRKIEKNYSLNKNEKNSMQKCMIVTE